MSQYTITDLVDLLQECAGADEDVDLNGYIMDTSFEDLGYDSLAMLQTIGRIEQIHQIKLPEDAPSEATTPRMLLELINTELGALV